MKSSSPPPLPVERSLTRLGQAISLARRRRHLTQDDLADRIERFEPSALHSRHDARNAGGKFGGHIVTDGLRVGDEAGHVQPEHDAAEFAFASIVAVVMSPPVEHGIRRVRCQVVSSWQSNFQLKRRIVVS